MTSARPAPPRTRDPIDALAAYAVRFHAALGADHHAASPLGAYLLMALVAPAATGADRAELEAVLGLPAEVAHRFATDLIAAPSPAVASAIALWNRPGIETERFERWRPSLPAGLSTGPIPSRDDADAWARAHTRGLIDRFPGMLEGTRPRMLVLASALACEGAWEEPFSLVPSERLGASAWAQEVRLVLEGDAPDAGCIVRTEAAGLVAVAMPRTEERLRVFCVLAAPEVGPTRVIAAAHEVAALGSDRGSTAARCSLFDLPLGTGRDWTIEESEVPTYQEGERIESFCVVMPAWRVEERVADLGDPAFGFPSVRASLAAMLHPTARTEDWQAVQATVADFDHFGFSAASLSSFGMEMYGGEEPIRRGQMRRAELRFARPFAAVAVAWSPTRLFEQPRTAPTPWAGVPVFSAWVTRPHEPDADRILKWLGKA